MNEQSGNSHPNFKPNPNPYAPPVAAVEDAFEAPAEGALIPGGRSVPAGNGVSWLGGGWELFRQQPGTWIGMTVIFFGIYLTLSLVPLVNMLNVLIAPLFSGGFMIACENQRNTGELKIGDLFGGFERKLGALVLLGAMTFALTLAMILVIAVIVGIGVGGSLLAGQTLPVVMAGIGAGTVILAVILAFIGFFLVYAAVWYAPALIVLHDIPVFEAMKMSFTGCIRNILPGLLYGAIFLALALFASLPILLGWLVLMPVMWASIHTAYRDIYIEE